MVNLIAKANTSAEAVEYKRPSQTTEKVAKTAKVDETNKTKRSSDLASRMLSTKKQLESESSNKNTNNENDWVYEW